MPVYIPAGFQKRHGNFPDGFRTCKFKGFFSAGMGLPGRSAFHQGDFPGWKETYTGALFRPLGLMGERIRAIDGSRKPRTGTGYSGHGPRFRRLV